jgi:CheY-like chemotaxis protein
VCDDDDGVRKLVVDVIAVRGYNVLQAANGKQAIDVAMQHEGRIDLVVTDVVMPGVGGSSSPPSCASGIPTCACSTCPATSSAWSCSTDR